MIPNLDVVDDDADADTRLLVTVADWAERYTPLVALGDGHGLMLDITGCAHLFGGEAALQADMTARLAAQGFAARTAIAATPGAAHALAHHGGGAAIVDREGTTVALAPLPLSALRLEPGTVAAMDRVGLKTIGQVAGQPRAPLAARFGLRLIRRLDQALGLEEEAIGPRRPAPAFLAERRFAEPIASEEDIARTIASLAVSLASVLEKHDRGAQRLEFTLFRVDGAVARVNVGASRPVRAPKAVSALFREKLAALHEPLDAGFGFDMARLAATALAEADASQIDLTGDAAGEADLGSLVDRVVARLGEGSVARMALHESHVPERAVRWRAWDGNAAPVLDTADALPVARPLRLFARPEPVEAVAEVPDGPPVRFRWRRVTFRVARAEGPERIATEWWRDDGLTRDYFRVEDAEGYRFWLYREGLYGRETTAPRWYLHGVFA